MQFSQTCCPGASEIRVNSQLGMFEGAMMRSRGQALPQFEKAGVGAARVLLDGAPRVVLEAEKKLAATGRAVDYAKVEREIAGEVGCDRA